MKRVAVVSLCVLVISTSFSRQEINGRVGYKGGHGVKRAVCETKEEKIEQSARARSTVTTGTYVTRATRFIGFVFITFASKGIIFF